MPDNSLTHSASIERRTSRVAISLTAGVILRPITRSLMSSGCRKNQSSTRLTSQTFFSSSRFASVAIASFVGTKIGVLVLSTCLPLAISKLFHTHKMSASPLSIMSYLVFKSYRDEKICKSRSFLIDTPPSARHTPRVMPGYTTISVDHDTHGGIADARGGLKMPAFVRAMYLNWTMSNDSQRRQAIAEAVAGKPTTENRAENVGGVEPHASRMGSCASDSRQEFGQQLVALLLRSLGPSGAAEVIAGAVRMT